MRKIRMSFYFLLIPSLLSTLITTACAPASSIDQAYYSGAISPYYPGGYTRSIFSSHNF